VSRGSRGRRRRTASLAAVAVAASGAVLLQSGAADPVLAAAVSRVTGGASEQPAASPSERTERVAWSWDLGAPTWNANPPQPSRLTPAKRIDPANPARPAAPVKPVPPDGTPPDDGRSPVWQTIVATNPKVELQPESSCPQYRGPSSRIWMTVTPIRGAVQLSWWDIADPEAVRWEIGAFARSGVGGSPSMQWTRVPLQEPRTCQRVTATVTGLASGVGYDFWLETVNRDPLDPSRTYRTSRGRTEVFRIP
jgi:hypothetical protein